MLILNQDNSQYFSSRTAKEAEEGLLAFIDQYAGTQVSRMLLCVNAMRASFDSRVFQPIWEGFDSRGGAGQPMLEHVDEADRERLARFYANIKALGEKTPDAYTIWLGRLREKGISPWVSIRMNDVHNADNEKHAYHSRLWQENPGLRRAMYRNASDFDRALDYGQKRVRDEFLAFIQEVAGRYDFDGLELDWMRFPYHFRPGHEAEGAVLLNGFVREVRRILDDAEKKWGHGIQLSARVASRPQTAIGLGTDALAWAREGLIDLLVVTPFWATAETDMPIELWKQLLAGTKTRLAAGLEVLLRAHPESTLFQMNSIETARGAAWSYLWRGADDIYLFNYMDRVTCMLDLENYPALLRQLGAAETMEGKTRRHVVTFADIGAEGEPRGHLLPAALADGVWRAFRINIGKAPGKNAKAYAVLGIRDKAGAAPGVYVNGALCEAEDGFALPPPKPDSAVVACRIKDGLLRDGYNLVEAAGGQGAVDWAEIYVE